MTANSPNDGLHEIAQRGLLAIEGIVKQRDELLERNSRILAENELLKQRVAVHIGDNARLKAERDHYMCYCTEIVSQLNNIQSIITDAVLKAKHGAFKPPTVPKPHTAPPEEPMPSFLSPQSKEALERYATEAQGLR